METSTFAVAAKAKFNLTDEAWIPILGVDGVRHTLSLQEVFASVGEIRELAMQPHEKIALLRLLICIAQAALDGPEDCDAWENCQADIPGCAGAYLEKWQAGFELFGDGPRFLQVPGLKAGKEEKEGSPATKLDLTLASGNNASIFDNAAGVQRTVGPARLALTLLAFQCFAPGGRIGVANWQGVETAGKGSSNHAPCIPSGMLHTFLHGENLLDTIHLNLLSMEAVTDEMLCSGWGRPIWETPVTSPGDKAAIANATTTYLGRLVPLSRAVRLDPGGLAIVLANGLDYPLYPIFREPAATVVPRKEGPGIMGVSLGRSLWRQLSAITVKGRAADPLAGPLALRNLGKDRGSTLWIGALATDKAKIEDLVEAAYDVPAGMFLDTGRKLYEEGIALADKWQNALSMSIKAYAATLKLEPPPYERGRQHFWTLAEQHLSALLRLAGDPDHAGELPASEWGRHVRWAAYASYEFACPHQSPRQIEAFVIGRQRMFLPGPRDPSKTPGKPARLQPVA